MATRRSTTQWALDTNVLLHLVNGKENVREAWEVARDKGIRLFATDVVLAELVALAEHAESERVRTLALNALKEMRNRWQIEPAILNSIERSIAAQFAGICLDKGIIPRAEKNDAMLLGEAATKRLPFVISSDSHLLNADLQELMLTCHALDLPLISVLHPTAAVRSLEG